MGEGDAPFFLPKLILDEVNRVSIFGSSEELKESGTRTVFKGLQKGQG